MGNELSNIQKANYEDVQYLINEKQPFLIINTMAANLQTCVIQNTIPIKDEERVMNDLITTSRDIKIIIYGKNANDQTIYQKYEQLCKIGFSDVYVYIGGMFEWLMLQDIYGADLFPTKGREIDILKYKPDAAFSKSGPSLYYFNQRDSNNGFGDNNAPTSFFSRFIMN
jgi:rhodanese-related sulfurtransferase